MCRNQETSWFELAPVWKRRDAFGIASGSDSRR
jgi:hypothetical protein